MDINLVVALVVSGVVLATLTFGITLLIRQSCDRTTRGGAEGIRNPENGILPGQLEPNQETKRLLEQLQPNTELVLQANGMSDRVVPREEGPPVQATPSVLWVQP